MLGVRVTLKDDSAKVRKAVARGTQKSLSRAGAYIRGIARKSIKVSPVKSAPGHPPHTRKGRLKRGILFAVEKAHEGVVIGPTATEVGKIGHTHEFGGTEPPKTRKGRKANWKLEVGGHGPVDVGPGGPQVARLETERQVERAKRVAATLPASQGGLASSRSRKYPPRPFMEPALGRSKDRLPKLWANSVKGA